MANVFKNAGITRGDRVMLVLKRHYEYWFAAVALHKLGAVVIPATHMLTVSDFVYRIKASEVKAIVCTSQDEVPQKVLSALTNAGATAKLWCVQADIEGFENLTKAMETADSELSRVRPSSPIPCFYTLPPVRPAIQKVSFTMAPIRWRIS